MDESKKWENLNGNIVMIVVALTVGVAIPVGYNLAVLNSLGDVSRSFNTFYIHTCYFQFHKFQIISRDFAEFVCVSGGVFFLKLN